MALLKRTSSSASDPHNDIQTCLQKQDFKGACAAFHRLLKANPRSTQMRLRYADTLVLARRKDDAVSEYIRVAEELAETGHLVKAVAIYKKVVKLDPKQSDVVAKLAHLDAERVQTPTVTVPSMPAPTPAAGGEFEFEAEEGGPDLELDIGGFAPAAAPAAKPVSQPEPPAAAKPAAGAPVSPPAARPMPDIDALADLAADDLADHIGLETEAPELEPSLAAPDELGAEDLAPEGALGAEDLAPADDLGADDLAPMPAPPPEPAAVEAEPAPIPSFDFGPAPAAPEPAPAAPAEGLGFDFGIPAAPPEGPAAQEPEPAPAPAAREAEAEEVDPFASDAAAAEEPLGPSLAAPAAAEGEDLLNLLGDDIDAMLDGIMTDVATDDAGAAAQLPAAETNIGLFSHLAIDEFIEVLKVIDRRTVKTGEVVVREGDPGSSMFIISSGKVEASVVREGKKVFSVTLDDGDFFGEIAVLSGAPRTATVTALANTELLELERERLQHIMARFPGIEAKLRLAYEERSQKTREFG